MPAQPAVATSDEAVQYIEEDRQRVLVSVCNNTKIGKVENTTPSKIKLCEYLQSTRIRKKKKRESSNIDEDQ